MKSGILKILYTKTIIATLVAIITFIIFLPALQNEFTGDDFGYVVRNTFIRSIDLNLFKSAFLSFQIANWHPLTWISHALDYALWGLNPAGHHLTNNILHAVNTFIVVLLVVRLIEAVHASQFMSYDSRLSTRDSVFALIAAAATGLLFGLHPMRVEAVAWVAERKELLCALFFLLSIVMYLKYAGRGGPLWPPRDGHPQSVAPARAYVLSLVFFTLALLSKPMAVTLPFVLLTLDWYPFNRIHSLRTFLLLLGEKVPFISLSLVASILTIMAQEEGGTIIPTAVIPLSSRALVAVKCLFAYLWKMMLPLNLMPAGYPYPDPKDVTIFSPEYLLWIGLMAGITITCVVIVKKQRVWLSVWMYYFVTLVPVLGIVKAGGMFMADRYSYLPSLGPSLVAGLLIAGIWEKILAKKQRRLLFEIGGVAAGLALLFSLSFITVKQIGLWKNDAARMEYLNRIRMDQKRETMRDEAGYGDLKGGG